MKEERLELLEEGGTDQTIGTTSNISQTSLQRKRIHSVFAYGTGVPLLQYEAVVHEQTRAVKYCIVFAFSQYIVVQ